MRICLASSYVPFINGGARFIVEWLEQKLREHGHEVERFYIPFIDSPHNLIEQMTAFRLIDLSESCDRLICFRPPSHVLPHPNKVLWFIHHIRVFYDMWDTPFCPVPATPSGRAVRQALIDADTNALQDAKAVYTNSRVVSDRLKKYNGVASTPLYPPILHPEHFRNEGYGDEIVMVCRIEAHKRQHLLVEAMRHVKSGVKLRLCGECRSQDYSRQLRETIRLGGLEERVIIEDRWITEDEKIDRLATALGAAYLPFDEDSYGYPSLEAAHSGKAVLTTTDSGGVLELVEDGRNGLITEPNPLAIAAAMDRFYQNKLDAKRWGENNTKRVVELKIDWSHVLKTLMA